MELTCVNNIRGVCLFILVRGCVLSFVFLIENDEHLFSRRVWRSCIQNLYSCAVCIHDVYQCIHQRSNPYFECWSLIKTCKQICVCQIIFSPVQSSSNLSQMVFCLQQMRKVCNPFQNSQCHRGKIILEYSIWNAPFLTRKVGNTINYFGECSQDLYFILFWYTLLSSVCGMVRDYLLNTFQKILRTFIKPTDICHNRHVQNLISLRWYSYDAKSDFSRASSDHSQKFTVFRCDVDVEIEHFTVFWHYIGPPRVFNSMDLCTNGCAIIRLYHLGFGGNPE